MVAQNSELSSLFNAGLSDLQLRLRNSGAAKEFMDNFDHFIETFGSRGPNEWETACETWGTNPASVLTLIDRMRLTDDQNSPKVRSQELSKKREVATLNARQELKGLGSWLFEKALHSSILFSQARERSKTTIVDLIHVFVR